MTANPTENRLRISGRSCYPEIRCILIGPQTVARYATPGKKSEDRQPADAAVVGG